MGQIYDSVELVVFSVFEWFVLGLILANRLD